MRILHYHRYDGMLQSINAVLGFAIVLPKCLRLADHEVDIFEEFDEQRSRKLMDCLYFMVNWLRESISGFVSQDGEMIRKKVICGKTMGQM